MRPPSDSCTRFLPLLLLLLPVLLLGPAAPAFAQSAPPWRALLAIDLVQDVDGSGDATCGDLVEVRTSLTPVSTDPLNDVLFDLPIDSHLDYRPGTLAVEHPEGSTAVLEGTQPDDAAVRVDYGDVCPLLDCPGNVLRVSFQAVIGAPTSGSGIDVIRMQGEVSGSNFPAQGTSAPPADTFAEPTELAFSCTDGGGTDFEGTLVDALVVDRDSDGLADAGDTVRYTARLRYTGTLSTSGTTYAAPLDPSSELVAGSVTTTQGAVTTGNGAGDEEVLVTIGRLGATRVTIRYDAVVVDPLPGSVSQLEDQGQVRTPTNFLGLTDDPSAPGNSDPTVTPLDRDPDLALRKTDGGVSAEPGEVVVYRLTVEELGGEAAAGVTITETVPDHATFEAGASSSGWSCTSPAAGGTCRLVVGSLAAGGSMERDFAVRVADQLPAGVTEIVNSASVSDDGSAGPDPDSANNSASDATPLTALTPALSLEKRPAFPALTPGPGDLIVWELAYSNTGTQAASDVILTDRVPEATTFDVEASAPGWACPPPADAGTTCLYLLGDLPAGDSGTIPFAVRLDDPLSPSVTAVENCAVLEDDASSGPGPQDLFESCSTVPVAGPPDLSIEKSDGDIEAAPGDTVTYLLTVRSVGGRDAPGAEIRETVPAHTRFAAGASSNGWSCPDGAEPGTECVLALGTLAPGAVESANFAVTVDSAFEQPVASILNVALVRDDGSAGIDPTPGDNEATETTPLMGLASDLTVAKDLSEADSDVRPAGLLVWAVSYRNRGSLAAQGVELVETVPDLTRFEPSASAAGWVCAPDLLAGSECRLDLGTVPAGQAGTATFAVELPGTLPADFQAIRNCVRLAQGAELSEPACSDVPIPSARPDVSLTKDDRGVTAQPGDVVTYDLRAANLGSRPALGVEIRETVPPHTVFAAAASAAGWSCPGGAPAGTECRLTVGELGPSDFETFAFAVRVLDPVPEGVRQLRNSALVTDDGSQGEDLDPGNNLATDTTPLDIDDGGGGGESPHLLLWKEDVLSEDVAADGAANPGEELTYVLTLINDSDAPALDLALHAPTPRHTTFVVGSVTTSHGEVVLGNDPGETLAQVEISELPAGETATISYRVIVNEKLPPDLDVIRCQAQLTGGNIDLVLSDDPETFEPLDPTKTPVISDSEGPVAIVDIPTLDQIGLILLIGLLGLLGGYFLRRSSSASSEGLAG